VLKKEEKYEENDESLQDRTEPNEKPRRSKALVDPAKRGRDSMWDLMSMFRPQSDEESRRKAVEERHEKRLSSQALMSGRTRSSLKKKERESRVMVCEAQEWLGKQRSRFQEEHEEMVKRGKLLNWSIVVGKKNSE